MASRKDLSIYDLFKGKLTFTDEPLWFRIVIVLIIVAFWVLLILSPHEWVFTYFAIKSLISPKAIELLKRGKGRSP